MNELILIDKIKNELAIHGITVETDPYKELKESLPCVLLELDDTEYEHTGDGYIKGQITKMTATCLVSAVGRGFTEYKNELIEYSKNVIDKLYLARDYEMKIKVNKQSFDEVMIGSLKATGSIIEFDVNSYWQ